MDGIREPIKALRPKRQAVDGICVDCGRETPAAEVARVLRIDSRGLGRVVCVDCSARIHAARQPAPIPLQRPTRRAGAADPGSVEPQREPD